LIKITVTDLDGQVHEIEASEGEKLMEVLHDYEWGTPAVCGGLCSCGTCHVRIAEGWKEKFPPIDSDEEELLNDLGNSDADSRLSCQLYLTNDHDGLELTIAVEE
jgi:2Fe-2S ferredoxin